MKITRKTICISMVIIIVIVSAAAGCSSKQAATAATDGTQSPTGQQGWSNQSGSSRPGRGGMRNSSGSTEGAPTGSAQGGATGGASSSGQKQILGKVTSIIGNEVVLAIGTQASDKTSSALTLTGENKTLLIPVGLSLSSGTAGAGSKVSGTYGAAGGMPTGGMPAGMGAASTKTSGNRATGTTGTTKTTGQSTTAKATTGATSGTATIKRTSDFSSITVGMVLRISQQTIDGTESVVRVAIVSK